MTANELVTQSLRSIGILQETESPSAEQSSTALTTLNDMMADLQADGVDVGYAPQSDPNVDIGLNIEDRLAIKSLLAVILCPDYERQPSPILVALAVAGRERLLRNAIINNPVVTPLTLPRGDGQGLFGIRFNILTGR